MTAKDLFEEDFLQVFCKKTGNYLGIIDKGKMLFSNNEVEEIVPEAEVDKNQLSMF